MSPGPERSPTEISLAQLAHIPSNEDVGEGSSRSAEYPPDTLQAGSATTAHPPQDFSAPPPDYTSPEGSMLESSRRDTDSDGEGSDGDYNVEGEETSLLRNEALERDATPIPSYDAAIGERSRD